MKKHTTLARIGTRHIITLATLSLAMFLPACHNTSSNISPPPTTPASQPAPPSTPPKSKPEPSAQKLDILERAKQAAPQVLIAKGDAAYANGNYATAYECYQDALDCGIEDPTLLKQVQEKLELAKKSAVADGRGLIDIDITRYRPIVCKTSSLFNSALDDAKKRLATKDYAGATKMARIAQGHIDGRKEWLSEAEYKAYSKQVTDLLEQIAKSQSADSAQ